MKHREKETEKNEQTLNDLWDNIKWSKIHVIGVPGDRGRMTGTENIVDIRLLKIMQI